jgi:hypothetical protein
VTCEHCGEVPAEGSGIPHQNVCPRFTCALCGAKFAVFPEPTKKLFGTSPRCVACKNAPAPKGAAWRDSV